MRFTKLIEKKKLLIVCGTGGVGKTTLAAALALKGALAGKKSLVITVDPAKRLAGILNLKTPCPDPKLVWQGQASFSACLLEAKQTFDDLIRHHAAKEIQESILQNPLYQNLSLMLAGTQEYMAMEKLYSLSTENQFDLIVVDTPPSKQAIDFLQAPMRLINMINDSVLRFLLAPAFKLGSFSSKIISSLSHLSGKEILEDIAELMQVSFSLLEGFTQRSDAIQSLISSKQCAFLLVQNLGPLLSRQGENFRAELEHQGFALEGILINRLPPIFGTPGETKKALAWAKKQKSPLWQTARKLLERNVQAHKQIEKQLKSFLNTLPTSATIPEIAEGIADFEDLKKIVKFL